MPIYAYKCESCGFSKDVLQKMSDAPLSDCPSCGGSTFKKQLTAAGFQLKGSGWYATDFKGGSTAAPASTPGGEGGGAGGGGGGGGGGDSAKPADSGGKTETAAAAPATASGCATSCACH
jgi:putative FmdB family regulatory protein